MVFMAGITSAFFFPRSGSCWNCPPTSGERKKWTINNKIQQTKSEIPHEIIQIYNVSSGRLYGFHPAASQSRPLHFGANCRA